uniref:Uncharacterized protein n=1 Tax=Rhizophora mucronata TaxID=61149 RepID=A0A2P2P0X8_RHIMU
MNTKLRLLFPILLFNWSIIVACHARGWCSRPKRP